MFLVLKNEYIYSRAMSFADSKNAPQPEVAMPKTLYGKSLRL